MGKKESDFWIVLCAIIIVVLIVSLFAFLIHYGQLATCRAAATKMGFGWEFTMRLGCVYEVKPSTWVLDDYYMYTP